MIEILLSIAPIFVLIVLGHALRRGGIPSIEFWNQNDRLVYWVLFPSLLFVKMSTLKIPTDLIGSYAVVILGGFFGTVLFALLAGRVLGLGSPAASSLLQGSVRHNTFIALAVMLLCVDANLRIRAMAAASGYTLARQMGGDAPLMAAMITLQTALCLITLPLTVLFARGLLGP